VGLWRNKEFRRQILLILGVSLLTSTIAFLLSPPSLLFILVLTGAILLIEVLFARYRYRKMARLSDYLKSVNEGNYQLEVDEYDEGELSILKSEIYKTTTTLRVQADALHQEKAQLADAMSDISHQLKTPLTSMLVMTDLLTDADLPKDKRLEFTERIKIQLERIEWLVTSLLKLARIDAGSVQFKSRRIPLKDLLEKSLQPLIIPMELRRQTLETAYCDSTILCDPNWTSEALLNVMKNCVEHTPVGGILHISCTGNALYTQITIRDNGEGIDVAELPHIFDRFYRGKNSSDDSVGIGLSMARSIISAQGGSIQCESQPGSGTTFIVKFFG